MKVTALRRATGQAAAGRRRRVLGLLASQRGGAVGKRRGSSPVGLPDWLVQQARVAVGLGDLRVADNQVPEAAGDD